MFHLHNYTPQIGLQFVKFYHTSWVDSQNSTIPSICMLGSDAYTSGNHGNSSYHSYPPVPSQSSKMSHHKGDKTCYPARSLGGTV